MTESYVTVWWLDFFREFINVIFGVSDEKFLAVADGKLRVLSLECGKEVLNISRDLVSVENIEIHG